MSQLRRTRRKDDFPYYIQLPAPNQTQMRSAVKGDDRPRRDNIKLAIALTLIVGGLYGLILLWSSL